VARPLNIVVFDSTQTALIPGLTYWWRAGAMLARVTRRADVVVTASTWRSALEQVRDAVRQRSAAGARARIGLIQFWGHGRDGAMLIDGEPLDSASLASHAGLRPLLDEVRDAIDPDAGTVWFRGCNTFRGAAGRRFARDAADFFRVPVVGHTFMIWAFHSGTHALRPGSTPHWPEGEGIRSAGRGRVLPVSLRSDCVWSDPMRTCTIPALRFFPPRHAAR